MFVRENVGVGEERRQQTVKAPGCVTLFIAYGVYLTLCSFTVKSIAFEGFDGALTLLIWHQERHLTCNEIAT